MRQHNIAHARQHIFKCLLSLLLILSGCGTFTPFLYNASLVTVDVPQDNKDRYSGSVQMQMTGEGEQNYLFSNEVFDSAWIVGSDRVHFYMTNKSATSIKIHWDEAVYIGMNGTSHRVMHKDVPFVERNNPQPPSVIPRGSTHEDVIIPTGNVAMVANSWYVTGLFHPVNHSQGTLEEARMNIDRNYSILLPVEIEGVTNEFTFTFTIKDVTTP